LKGVSLTQVRGGLILAIFGFVGFESAASLGVEAANPLKTIPRAVSVTAWISGLFFILAAYAESIGFAGHADQLAQSGAPLQLLSGLRHLPFLSVFITATTVCSFFACNLACISATSRILYKLSHDHHLHRACGLTHEEHRTPHIAIIIASVIILAGVLLMSFAGVVPFDIYGWSGTFATYGFITAYFLVSIGSAVLLRRTKSFTIVSTISLLGSLFILGLAAVSSFDATEGAYHRLPYIYIVTMVLVLPYIVLRRKSEQQKMPEELLGPSA
jgi:amino acid transporter